MIQTPFRSSSIQQLNKRLIVTVKEYTRDKQKSSAGDKKVSN